MLQVLDPLIILQGKNFQSLWCGDMVLPDIYGVTVTDWMETDVFKDWFDAFADKNKGFPMLLLFDGHMTHISTRLLKFPLHVTDILQPLDK